jgi:hypothetical protein
MIQLFLEELRAELIMARSEHLQLRKAKTLIETPC